MQHGKVTKKVEQIEKIASSPEKITENIYSVMDKFGISKILMPLNKLKRSGTPPIIILTTLIILPFISKNSIWSFFIKNTKFKEQGGKDAYYNLKNNPKISWRTLLYVVAKRFIFLLSGKDKDEEQKARIKALILDDTIVEKTGKHIEGTSYVHDHVIMNYVFGYKVLVSGYWDGDSFIPIDFSIHREKRDRKINKAKKRKEKKNEQIRKTKQEIKKKREQIKSIKAGIKKLENKNRQSPTNTNQKHLKAKKNTLTKRQMKLEELKKQLMKQQEEYQYLENAYEERKANYKKYGLSKKEIREQYKKKREKNDFGYKRKKELDNNKIDSAISLIKRAVSKGFKFDYVLTDSWFFCSKILEYIVSHTQAHFISMAKIGISKYKILPQNKYYTPAQIIKIFGRHAKTNRKYKARYIRLQAEYQGQRVVIFLINIGKGANARLLVSTDLKISFNKLMDVYKIRWSIEVFFKEAKQYLLFNKSQSRDFDGQIADLTLSMIRYILLSYYKRLHYGISIGGLFREISQMTIEENIVADISAIFMELLEIMAEFVSIDFFTFFQELISRDDLQEKLTRLRLIPNSKAA